MNRDYYLITTSKLLQPLYDWYNIVLTICISDPLDAQLIGVPHEMSEKGRSWRKPKVLASILIRLFFGS